MASRAALEAGRRMQRACEAVCAFIGQLPSEKQSPALTALDRLERAAIKVGEVRERGRRPTPGGPRGK